MSIVSEVTELLTKAGVKVASRSVAPPFAMVRFGGSSEVDPSLSRGDVTVWCVESYGQDPQPLAGKVWRALRSDRFIPRQVISQTSGPTPDGTPKWDVILITADTTYNWWSQDEA